MKVSILQVDRCKPILGLNAFDHAPVRQHLERELVQSPVQDSQIQDWPKATTFLGYDEVRAVKPLPHLGWRDRLDCILCQEDSNLLAQDRGVPDCHRRLENAVELGRSPGELNRAQLLHQPRVGTTLVHLFERLGLVNLQDSHGVQGGGCLARSTVSFGRESGCQFTGLGRETRTVPPSGGVSWAQVHRDRSLHLGNARVPPGHSAVEGSEDGGGGRAASGRERGHPRTRQLLMHLREERHRGRARL